MSRQEKNVKDIVLCESSLTYPQYSTHSIPIHVIAQYYPFFCIKAIDQYSTHFIPIHVIDSLSNTTHSFALRPLPNILQIPFPFWPLTNILPIPLHSCDCIAQYSNHSIPIHVIAQCPILPIPLH